MKPFRSAASPILLAVAVCAANTHAGEYTVPDQFPTIQSAIDFAVHGDTIWVKPGKYGEVLTLSENIRVVSTGGPGVTTLTNQVDNQNTILTISGGVNQNARVEGFTFEPPADDAISIGGNSSPRITDCVIRHFDQSAVRINGGAPVFVSTKFVDNRGANLNGLAAHITNSNAEFQGCEFSGNGADFGTTLGGAVYTTGGNPRFQGCSFLGNTIPLEGGSGGGAMFCVDSVAEVSGCTFADNVGRASGALYVRRASAVVRGSSFYDNLGNTGGAIIGNDTEPLLIVNCQFVGNHANLGGGAAAQVDGGTMRVSNITAVNNTAGTNQGTVFRSTGAGSSMTVVNAVMFGSVPSLTYTAGGGTLAVTYSNCQGGLPGAGNIDKDPRFMSYFGGDFRLGPGSAGVDAGDNSAPGHNGFDFGGKPRFVDDPSTADTGKGQAPIIDMGAFEFPGGDYGSCRPDFDNNGVLDLFDFLGFVNAFNAGC